MEQLKKIKQVQTIQKELINIYKGRANAKKAAAILKKNKMKKIWRIFNNLEPPKFVPSIIGNVASKR